MGRRSGPSGRSGRRKPPFGPRIRKKAAKPPVVVAAPPQILTPSKRRGRPSKHELSGLEIEILDGWQHVDYTNLAQSVPELLTKPKKVAPRKKLDFAPQPAVKQISGTLPPLAHTHNAVTRIIGTTTRLPDNPGHPFDFINRCIALQRDARLEGWDGLPVRM